MESASFLPPHFRALYTVFCTTAAIVRDPAEEPRMSSLVCAFGYDATKFRKCRAGRLRSAAAARRSRALVNVDLEIATGREGTRAWGGRPTAVYGRRQP